MMNEPKNRLDYDEKEFLNFNEFIKKSSPDLNDLKDLKSKIDQINNNKKQNESSNENKKMILVNNVEDDDDDNNELNEKKEFLTFKLIRFIVISAIKLRISDTALATSSIIFQKFFKNFTFNDFDPYLVAAASIYLSCKVEEEEVKLRDIINVCYRTRHSNLNPLELGEKYWSLRNSVIQIELLIVRVLAFKVDFDHPHKYLLQYLESLRHWLPLEIRKVTPIPETSWQILRDLLHSDLFLRYRPQDIALSIIYFVSICYGVKVPYNDVAKNPWWKALDDKSSRSCMHEIIDEIIKVYEFEKKISEFLQFS